MKVLVVTRNPKKTTTITIVGGVYDPKEKKKTLYSSNIAVCNPSHVHVAAYLSLHIKNLSTSASVPQLMQF